MVTRTRELVDEGIGPVLTDGTPVADLVDLEHREVSMRVLFDPEVYELELQRLFARAWCVVAHESEVPRAGDFVLRQIGDDPVIVTRTRRGELSVLLNACTHRGMQVCRTAGGNSSRFTCPYHGWVYDEDGRFVAAPVAIQHMEGDVRPKAELGLRRARAETFAGMVFASFDDDAPTLSEYLGEIKWYLELMFDRTDDGLEVLGPPQRFVIPANWKCPSEQHNTDSYHTVTLHRSLMELGFMDDSADHMGGVNVSHLGHGLRCVDERHIAYKAFQGAVAASMDPIERLRRLPPAGLTPEMVPMLERRFSSDQLRVLADCPPQVGGLFPNVGTFSVKQPAEDGMSAILCWHAFMPKGPDHFEFYNWYFAERSAPDEMRERISRSSSLAFGTGGFIETDDADTWPQMTRSARGVIGRQGTLKYHALSGINRPQDWPGGGDVCDGFAKDDNQWNWWKRWREFMVGDPWAALR